MQRLRVQGAPEAVFEAIQKRLRRKGIEPRLVDPASITLLFDMDAGGEGRVSTFFLAVVHSDDRHSDVAVARRRSRKEENLKAMLLGEDDPLETKVLRDLVGKRGH